MTLTYVIIPKLEKNEWINFSNGKKFTVFEVHDIASSLQVVLNFASYNQAFYF